MSVAHSGEQAVELVRHGIHSGGFQAYALRFVSVLGSAKAGIHGVKLGGGLKSTVCESGESDRREFAPSRSLLRSHRLGVVRAAKPTQFVLSF